MLVGGQDVTDVAVDLKPGQNVDNVTVVLTDRTTEMTGTVRDSKGAPMTAITVIAFSTEQQFWRAQSRHILTSRTDAAGAFRLRELPPGDYFVVAVDGVEQGEWFDPAYLEQARNGATRITRGGTKQDLGARRIVIESIADTAPARNADEQPERTIQDRLPSSHPRHPASVFRVGFLLTLTRRCREDVPRDVGGTQPSDSAVRN